MLGRRKPSGRLSYIFSVEATGAFFKAIAAERLMITNICIEKFHRLQAEDQAFFYQMALHQRNVKKAVWSVITKSFPPSSDQLRTWIGDDGRGGGPENSSIQKILIEGKVLEK